MSDCYNIRAMLWSLYFRQHVWWYTTVFSMAIFSASIKSVLHLQISVPVENSFGCIFCWLNVYFIHLPDNCCQCQLSYWSFLEKADYCMQRRRSPKPSSVQVADKNCTFRYTKATVGYSHVDQRELHAWLLHNQEAKKDSTVHVDYERNWRSLFETVHSYGGLLVCGNVDAQHASKKFLRSRTRSTKSDTFW